ncbi:MAG TPA: hypothetical protein VEJ87_11480, partial [Acidimicrobiales bacterium]|nr:hypothetical protein [Acidimicrobiales bacterium]
MRASADVGLHRSARPASPLSRLLSTEHAIPLLVASFAVILANAPTIVHLLTTNPIQLFSFLSPAHPVHQLLSGRSTIDPAAGNVTQASGALAARDWLSGHLPWWNPYAGFGMPLAGDIQSAAFFPLVILLAGGGYGILFFHIALELTAAWATYFLIRRLGVGKLGATTGAVAFGLCGTFAWLANATVNPVAFLPLALLGVERCREAAREKRLFAGWALLAIALALSILAGFPEVAYLDGLLVVWWCLLRLTGTRETILRFAGNLAVGLVVAVAIAAPTEVAFATYLHHANVGAHSGQIGNQAMASQGVAQLLLPYVYGPILGLNSTAPPDLATSIWGIAGGYVSVILVTCALWGAVGRRLRLLRIGLCAWTVVGVLKTFGVPPVAHLVTHLPGFSNIATDRYATASYELAVVVLAALGIDDLVRGRLKARTVLVCGSICALLVVAMLFVAWPVLTHTSGATHPHRFAVVSAVWALAGIAALIVGGLIACRASGPPREKAPRADRRPDRRRGALIVSCTVIIDAIALFAAPLLSAPNPAPLEEGSVHYLQSHLGTARFATLGPIQPNYGSYFGIYELSLHDLPIPKGYSEYASKYLDPNALPYQITGTTRTNPNAPGPAPQLTAHLVDYERAGVKYIVTFGTGSDVFGEPWPTPGIEPAPKLVFEDSGSRIYELPSTRPFFSTPGSSCSITTSGYDEAVVRCPRASTLVRLEQDLPGWRATVRGRASQVNAADGPFQSVRVPAGTSTVRFSFVPPHGDAALVVSVIAILVTIAGVAFDVRFKRRKKQKKSQPRHARHSTVVFSTSGGPPHTPVLEETDADTGTGTGTG